MADVVVVTSAPAPSYGAAAALARLVGSKRRDLKAVMARSARRRAITAAASIEVDTETALGDAPASLGEDRARPAGAAATGSKEGPRAARAIHASAQEPPRRVAPARATQGSPLQLPARTRWENGRGSVQRAEDRQGLPQLPRPGLLKVNGPQILIHGVVSATVPDASSRAHPKGTAATLPARPQRA